jgi:diguanylate cyclase (GGDEF)-like protein/PAS domain S-box-containing protein
MAIHSDQALSIKRTLIIGFGIMLVLVIAIAGIGLMRMHSMEVDIETVLDRTHKKAVAIESMRNAVQNRRYSLSMITVLNDEFEIAEEWERYNEAASDYLIARSDLIQSRLDTIEQLEVKRLDDLTRIGQPMQQNVLELLEFEDRPTARKYLLTQARPAQQNVIDQIDRIYELELQKSIDAGNHLQKINAQYFIVTLLLATGAVFLGIMVSSSVIRKTLLQTAEVEHQQRRFKSLFDASLDAVMFWHNMRMTECNKTAIDLFGLDSDRESALHLTELLPETQPDGDFSREMMGEQLTRAEKGETCHFECQFIGANEKIFPAEVMLNSVILDGVYTHQMVIRDISERHEAVQQIEHMATHDILTGLVNKHSLIKRLIATIQNAANSGSMFAILNINLKRFKHINKSLGQSSGDQVLIMTAERLRTLTNDNDTLARVGADEYVLIRDQIEDIDEVYRLADTINDLIVQPYVIEKHVIHSGANIGISLYPQHGLSADILLKNAESAMHSSREDKTRHYHLYSDAINADAIRRMKLENGIKTGLNEEQFEIYYQPKFSIKTNRFIGMEALLRWNHPELGEISPAEFIPLAEEIELIAPLGEWVLLNACTHTHWLNTNGHPGLRVAVNLSPMQFHTAKLDEIVAMALEKSQLNADNLELEITESVALSGKKQTIETLTRLKEMGVHVAIDDFGTGYSSLSYLNRLPIDTLKIDQSFVRDLDKDKDHAEITSLITILAHNLGLKVVAEGVESQEHLDILNKQTCDEAQGFYLGKPMPWAVFQNYMHEQNLDSGNAQ